MSNTSNLDLATRAQWQKWEMDNLRSRPKNKTPAKNSNALLQSAKLKQQQTEIFNQAKSQGHKQGYDEGYKNGFLAGEKHGLQSGSEQGYIDGLASGHQKGYQQGLLKGAKIGDEQSRQSAEQLKTLLNSVSQSINNLEQDIGQSAIKLALEIAKQVLGTQLKEHPEHILAIIQELINRNTEPNQILRIHLNPADLNLVERFQTSKPEYNFKLIATEDIQAGGCIIDTESGCIDASLESRWLRIIGALGYSYEYSSNQ